MDREADPIRGLHGGEVDQRLALRDAVLHDLDAGAVQHRNLHEAGHDVGDREADQDRDDLDHALAPDVADADHDEGDEGERPVALAGADGDRREAEADRDDDRAGDDRREAAHHSLDAERLDRGGQHEVDEARARDAQAGVGKKLLVEDGVAARNIREDGHRRVAAEERERRAEERGDLPAGDQVEEQRARAGHQESRPDVEARDQRDGDGGPEHGEHVLEAEDQGFRGAELGGALADGGGGCVAHGAAILVQPPVRRQRIRSGNAGPRRRMRCGLFFG